METGELKSQSPVNFNSHFEYTLSISDNVITGQYVQLKPSTTRN